MSVDGSPLRENVVQRLSQLRDLVRMNFDEAMLAHAEWKLKLHLFLHGEGHLDAAVVCRDDACKLGKWLYSDGLKFANDSTYEELRHMHALFHKCAAGVVSTIAQGHKAQAQEQIGHGSEYDALSSEVVDLIAKMKRRVEEKTNLIMGNVLVGILVVDAGLIVQSGYSQHCHELLGARRVAGRHVCDLLGLTDSSAEQFEACMVQAFEDVLPPEVSLAMLPERVRIASRVVGIRASAIRSGGSEVDYALFTLEDVTRVAELEAERAEGHALIRAVRNRHAFSTFARDARLRLASLIEAPLDEPTVRREVHTIKGNAGLFELGEIVSEIDRLEEKLWITHADLSGLAQRLDATIRRFEEALGIGAVEDESSLCTVDQATLTAYETELARSQSDHERARLLRDLMRRLRMRSVRAILGPVEDRVALLAARLEKVTECHVVGGELLVNERVVAPVVQVLAHALRNAVDHGIECEDERVQRNKAPCGRVELRFEAGADGALLVSLMDDGRGIDGRALCRKATSLGLLTEAEADSMSAEQQLELVFLDGFTTAERTTDISGRGVGMSALKAAVAEVGGEIRINSEPGAGTMLQILIPGAADAGERSWQRHSRRASATAV